MSDTDPPPAPGNPPLSPFQAFADLAGKLVNVPKAEADAEEAKYQREQAKKPERGPKPKE